ncbi:response regulator transcription factor [Arenicella xantha]|uniref:LuxR family two component transcriptional regulator n=1 Tax=Arenicella xantha TaxID=644221 RepID=A0A395JIK9_9GAMM|nr:response regulator transcription factor [Arenicella xantha]RBP49609.1 LuxR family two component transcriptional regulator [Arenicella xantha]
MITTILAEDQSLLRGALATLLSLEADIEVLAQACDGSEALEHVKKLRPDVLVTDIEMPNKSGIELAQEIQRLNLATKVLVVTTFARPGYLERARAAGVSGYVLKDAPSEDLAQTVRRIAAGQTVIDPALAEAAWATSDPLSDRERAILRLAEAGHTNKRIAKQLHLSAGTVRNYLAQATQKLGAGNRIEAFRIARENGWL